MEEKLASTLQGALIKLLKNEAHIFQSRKDDILKWAEVIEKSCLLPIRYPTELASAVINSVTQKKPLVFHMIICPAYKNQKNYTPSRKPRRLVPLSASNKRLQNLAREVLALSIGTKKYLSIYPEFIFLINDIFQDNINQMVDDIREAPEILKKSKRAIAEVFILVEKANFNSHQPFFKQIGFKTPKIYMQSDFVSQLGKVGLPVYNELLHKVRFLTYDPKSDAFQLFLRSLLRVRKDYSYSPNSWLTEQGCTVIWDRVRFLVSQYWIDGRVNPVLIQKIFGTRVVNRPIFICGVDRRLAAEFEMDGFNFGAVSTDKLNGVSLAKEPNPVCSIFNNVANWLDLPKPPFNFGDVVILK